jgi:hypothetical protein
MRQRRFRDGGPRQGGPRRRWREMPMDPGDPSDPGDPGFGGRRRRGMQDDPSAGEE